MITAVNFLVSILANMDHVTKFTGTQKGFGQLLGASCSLFPLLTLLWDADVDNLNKDKFLRMVKTTKLEDTLALCAQGNRAGCLSLPIHSHLCETETTLALSQTTV